MRRRLLDRLRSLLRRVDVALWRVELDLELAVLERKARNVAPADRDVVFFDPTTRTVRSARPMGDA